MSPSSSALAALLLAAVAAGAPAPPVAPPPREAGHYFPTTGGTKWVYVWTRGGNKGAEVTEVVTVVEPGIAGGTIVTVGHLHTDGKAYPTMTYEVSERGLFWKENLVGRRLFRPWCLLKLPHQEGQTWGDDVSGLDTNMTAHGLEQIEVPAGVFDCVCVEYRDNRGPAVVQTRWYAHGVGEVKVVSGSSHRVLKSFTPGKG